MNITEAKFAGSSYKVSQLPEPRLPEFAFIGRSNVGKSSLINMLCNRRKLAMTSSTPGKTRLINHFMINKEWYLVDLPGYGYAKMSQKSKGHLQDIIADYLNNSNQMVMLFILVDSRHDIGKIDKEFINEMGINGIPFAIIFTKGDKKGPNALKSQIETNKNILLQDWAELPPVFVSSSETGMGRDEILNYIDEVLHMVQEQMNQLR